MISIPFLTKRASQRPERFVTGPSVYEDGTIERSEASILEFFAYETIGACVGASPEALARTDFD